LNLFLTMACKKFIIPGTARTGSNYLSQLLQNNPEILVPGELFNLDNIKIPVLKECLGNPVQYPGNRISNSGADKAVGFNTFYKHPTREYFHKRIPKEETATRLLKQSHRFQQYDEIPIGNLGKGVYSKGQIELLMFYMR
jgi:hypothetical protein